MKPKTTVLKLGLWVLLASLLSAPAYGATKNAGFVQGLWYDQETVLVGHPVRIYAAIRNNTGGDLSGTVEFYINGDRIERTSVSALSGRIIESWTDWTPTYGTSTIKAVLSRTELSSTASGTVRIDVVSALTEDIIFVDRDTDHDGVGDATDTDDDNDGISDQKEKQNGTDLLDPDDPAPTDDTTANEPDTTEPDTASENETSDGPSGLERYLADSRAKEALTTITDTITSARTGLDEYRETRNRENTDTTSTTEDGSSGEETTGSSTDTTLATSTDTRTGSFGTVERHTSETPKQPFWSTVWNAFKTATNAVYTFVLWLISLFLWHPVVVQLTLMFLILFGLYLLARKFGRRERT